ncbi:GNAT family N-acetyltransferase [Fulvimarina sp. MAC8]|uniref:GNAT family N-acetyltransferase n=1 Tax=Fulvimarina sp. MAC8 TaxID=3162874 RepID=UPI0032EEC7EE
MTVEAEWRTMMPGDLEEVVRIADRVHPDFREPVEVFADRLRIWPAGALVCHLKGALCGYAIGHPVRFPDIPALGSVLGELPENADAFYVHDVALLPEMRGRSLSGGAIESLLEGVPEVDRACLISVYGTAVFWRRHGFREAPDAVPREKLASYGPEAVFMVRDL